jgi:hypothetical protein
MTGPSTPADGRRSARSGRRLRGDDRSRAAAGGTLRGDDRAVSTALGYVLSLAIASLLISGLMLAAGGFVESERERVVRSELEVIGQTLVADVEGADRLASSIDGDVRVRSSLPRRVGSSTYTIEIRSDAYDGFFDGYAELYLNASSVDASVTYRIVTATPFGPSSSSLIGGELVIVYDGGADQLEVREA